MPVFTDSSSMPVRFERSSVRRSSCVANARDPRRAQSCSSRRFSRKARGSSRTMGCSSSTASSNTSGTSTGTSVRVAAPRASFWKWRPCCPRRSLSATFGSAANARRLRMPQRARVSSRPLADFFSSSSRRSLNNTSTGREPRCSASLPAGITVMLWKPRAASRAASGLEATAMLALSPSAAARSKIAREILFSDPNKDSIPARSRRTVSQAASSTQGENDWAQSSKAACADDSCKAERVRRTSSEQSSA